MLHRIKKKMTMAGVLVIVGAIWGGLPVFAAEMPVESVSENSVSENSVPDGIDRLAASAGSFGNFNAGSIDKRGRWRYSGPSTAECG